MNCRQDHVISKVSQTINLLFFFKRIGNTTYVTGNILINFCCCCIGVKKTDKKTGLTGREDINFCEAEKRRQDTFILMAVFFFFFDFVKFTEIIGLPAI